MREERALLSIVPRALYKAYALYKAFLRVVLFHGGPNFPNLQQIGKIVPNLQKQIGNVVANWESNIFLQIGKIFPNLQLSQFAKSQIGKMIPNLQEC